jgi:hypothetical protein
MEGRRHRTGLGSDQIPPRRRTGLVGDHQTALACGLDSHRWFLRHTGGRESPVGCTPFRALLRRPAHPQHARGAGSSLQLPSRPRALGTPDPVRGELQPCSPAGRHRMAPGQPGAAGPRLCPRLQPARPLPGAVRHGIRHGDQRLPPRRAAARRHRLRARLAGVAGGLPAGPVVGCLLGDGVPDPPAGQAGVPRIRSGGPFPAPRSSARGPVRRRGAPLPPGRARRPAARLGLPGRGPLLWVPPGTAEQDLGQAGHADVAAAQF